MELAAYLMDQALRAKLAGELDAAGELRGRADTLTGAVQALENAVAAVEDAASVADEVSADAKRLLDERIATSQPPGDQRAECQPADVA